MADAPQLIVGLGNPGQEYAYSRHNVGFLTVDDYLENQKCSVAWKSKFHGDYLSFAERHWLKPTTFMNLSGKSLQPCMQWLKLLPQNVLVIHDELDLPDGIIKMKFGGGHGGHNGLRSIIDAVGADFWRLRIGVGKPPADFKGDGADFVLERLAPKKLQPLVAASTQALTDFFELGPEKGMQLINSRATQKSRSISQV